MQKMQPARISRRTGTRFLILVAMFGGIGALLLWAKATATNVPGISLPAALQDFITLTLSVVVEALPFVILGAVVSAIIRLYVPPQLFVRLLPQQPALRRLYVSLLGTFMPVCECGNVPVARGLMLRGLSVSESTTFLLAAPIINPVTLFATSQAFRFDPSIVWTRMAGASFLYCPVMTSRWDRPRARLRGPAR